MSLSVLILTKNEEQDIAGCIESVSWSDDIHVYDSLSTDNTVALAESFNAKVTQRKFDNYASQRNSALQQLSFKYPWVFILDADERIPLPLATEIEAFVSAPPDQVVAGRIRRRDYFWGTWLKHAQMSPFYIRLVQPMEVFYEREVNEVIRVNGKIYDFQEPFDHYPFSKGISHWIDKHNRYSTLEAQQILKLKRENIFFELRKILSSKDFNERRYYQKQLYYRLPFRPIIKLFYLIFFRGAFWDGKAGIIYSLLLTFYEYMIMIKVYELTHS
jgi:glycosyltransferase involved in cell wall biosynthesis